ncbi:carbohydrate ABC transporter permease [Pseudoruegeria sp. SK021]|uniref:carbohydrate ABC transporter permease n=1 Tax=Pseudoruegeria sp. SK021 TaxID=1933035 RepID=UPI000A327050|nr:sugar ABC transporter permease [Pseudoruegeria sp. SK021]
MNEGTAHSAAGPAQRSAARRRHAVPYLLIAPALVLAAVIVLWPLTVIGNISLHDVNRFGQLRGFSGLANFAELWRDPDFIATLWRTLIWTIGVVGGTLILSVPVALVLNRDFHGRALARVIIMLPWSVSVTMTAVVWRWALNGESGMLNSALRAGGITESNIVWLSSAATAFPIQIGIGILVSIPFTVTVFLAGLSSVPEDIYEAASIEGASSWQQLRTITLPMLRPFMTLAVVLNVIYVFNSFPIIWVLTQGGPANSTDILVTYLYKLAFRFGQMGQAAAVSIIMFAILLAITLLYVRLVTKTEAKS